MNHEKIPEIPHLRNRHHPLTRVDVDHRPHCRHGWRRGNCPATGNRQQHGEADMKQKDWNIGALVMTVVLILVTLINGVPK
jgi:hypothetical protein